MAARREGEPAPDDGGEGGVSSSGAAGPKRSRWDGMCGACGAPLDAPGRRPYVAGMRRLLRVVELARWCQRSAKRRLSRRAYEGVIDFGRFVLAPVVALGALFGLGLLLW